MALHAMGSEKLFSDVTLLPRRGAAGQQQSRPTCYERDCHHKPGSIWDRAVGRGSACFVLRASQGEAEAMDLRRKRVRATLASRQADATLRNERDDGRGRSCYELACRRWGKRRMDAETLRAQAEAKRMKFERGDCQCHSPRSDESPVLAMNRPGAPSLATVPVGLSISNGRCRSDPPGMRPV